MPITKEKIEELRRSGYFNSHKPKQILGDDGNWKLTTLKELDNESNYNTTFISK
jgi:hypothetical protein